MDANALPSRDLAHGYHGYHQLLLECYSRLGGSGWEWVGARAERFTDEGDGRREERRQILAPMIRDGDLQVLDRS